LELRQHLHSLIESTRGLAKDTSSSLKTLDTFDRDPNEEKNKRLLQSKLMKDFQTWLHEFTEVAKASSKKEESTPLPRPPSSSFRQETFSGSYAFEDNPTEQDSLLADQQKQLQFDNERAFNDALIQDRQQGIKEIAKTVQEVNEIFTDLAHLVNEQGVLIDNIETNVEASVQHTSKGVVELRKASDYQKSARTKMCCLALILLIVAGVAVGAVFLFKAH